ncbi:MAG TPA: PDZ domain-containing protein [Chitinophagaceae bacterium]|nr:PDZ domain-containing protein [Chitinophagaceae bacterium]
MHTILKTSALLLAVGLTVNTYAQADKAMPKKESGDEENIVIRKKANNTDKVTIVVDGDKVTVNGKPVDDYKGDGVEITKEKPWPNISYSYAPLGQSGDWEVFKNRFGTTLKSNKAVLGVMTEKVDDGARVTDVTDGSAADKAGIKEGDIITKFGDENIADADDLYKAVGKYKPEDKVTLGYKRDGKDATAQVTLQKNKDVMVYGLNGTRNFNMKVSPNIGAYSFRYGKPRMGVQVQDTEDGKGIKVLDVEDDTPADKAGLKEDDLITQVNGKNITSVDDLKEAIKDAKDGDTYKVTYVRDGQTKTADVHYPKDLKTSNL